MSSSINRIIIENPCKIHEFMWKKQLLYAMLKAIIKTGDYKKNKLAAYKLMEEVVERNNRATNLKQKQDACDYFLNNCYKAGLIYEDH